MDARPAKVEAPLEHIGREIVDMRQDVRTIRTEASTDFRLLFGALIFASLGLAGLMAKGFRWL